MRKFLALRRALICSDDTYYFEVITRAHGYEPGDLYGELFNSADLALRWLNNHII